MIRYDDSGSWSEKNVCLCAVSVMSVVEAKILIGIGGPDSYGRS